MKRYLALLTLVLGAALAPFMVPELAVVAATYFEVLHIGGGDGDTDGGLSIDAQGAVATDGEMDIGSGQTYKVNGTQISSDDLSDTASIGMLDEAETIAGNWVNTANPWADNEVSDTITVGSGGSVADGALSANVAHLNTVETISNNWVNTANPWADNEVASDLTLSGGLFSGNMSFSGDRQFYGSTSDGSDSNYIGIGAGGPPISNSRGADIVLGGNEDAAFPGQIRLRSGEGDIIMYCDGTEVLRLDETDDGVEIVNDLTLTGDLYVNGGDLSSTAETLNVGPDSDSGSGTLALNGDLTVSGYIDAVNYIYSDIWLQSGGTEGSGYRGTLKLVSGASGTNPGTIQLSSPNGTVYYLFVEDDGTLKIHTSLPTQNSDGSAVGDQTD